MFNIILDQTEERISKLKDRPFEIIQLGEQKRKKNEKVQRKPEGTMGHENVYHHGSPRMRKKIKEQKAYLNI